MGHVPPSAFLHDDDEHDIFLSYSRTDTEMMLRVKHDLEAEGFRVWIDQTGIPVGTANWRVAIQRAIRNGAVLLVILSPAANESRWVNEEIDYASMQGKPIFGALGRGPEKDAIPFGYSRLQYVNLTAEATYPAELYKLVLELGRLLNREPLSVAHARVAEEEARRQAEAEAKRIADEEAARQRAEREARDKANARLRAGLEQRQQVEAREQFTPPAPPRIEVTPPPPPAPRLLTLAEASAAVRVQAIIGKPFSLCKVPAGPFLFGKNNQTLELPTFLIAKYPITYSQFQVFVEAQYGYHDDRWWQGLAIGMDDRKLTKPRSAVATHPCVVNLHESIAFCRWLSYRLRGVFPFDEATQWVLRLPLEVEWEKAARGTDGRVYPWGNDFDESRCNSKIEESDIGQITPVDQYPQGASPYGVVDMSGNAWEWCLSVWTNPYDHRHVQDIDSPGVLQGSSWSNLKDIARVAFYHIYGGFRVVASAPILGALVSGA